MKENYPFIKLVFVPGGCTGNFQPADVVLQRPLKLVLCKRPLKQVLCKRPLKQVLCKKFHGWLTNQMIQKHYTNQPVNFKELMNLRSGLRSETFLAAVVGGGMDGDITAERND